MTSLQQQIFPLCAPGGKAGLNDLHAKLGVEVANAQQLRPHANVGHQWVHPNRCAHLMELRPKLWALPNLLPAKWRIARTFGTCR
jgi:hypothetical protein